MHPVFKLAKLLPLIAAITVAAGCASTPPVVSKATLTNTYWKLTELHGARVTMAPEQEREVRITLDNDGKVSGFTGCNQLMGGYTVAAEVLRFTQLGSTRMMCPAPAMQLESAVLAHLNSVTGFRIEGEQLILLKDGAPVARYESVYLQ